MIITQFQENDKKQVLDLFERVFKKRITEDFWKWRYDNFGHSIRYLMKQDHLVIGHYVVHPIPFHTKKGTDMALFSMSVMSDSHFSGHNIFAKLAREVYKKSTELGYKLVYGFPNKNSAEIHFNKLGWKNFGNRLEYKKAVEDKPDSFSNDFKIQRIFHFSDTFDSLWEKNKTDYKFIVPRTSNYLKWRFESCPQQKFLNYTNEKYYYYLVEDLSEVVAYFVLKKFGKEKVHLVDYCGLITRKIMKTILNYGLKFATHENVSEFSLWENQYFNYLEFEKIYDELKFERITTDSYFGFKLLDHSLDAEISNEQNWFITMSDSDVY